MRSFRQSWSAKMLVLAFGCYPFWAAAQSAIPDSVSSNYPLIYYNINKSKATSFASVLPGTAIAHMPVISYTTALAGQLTGLKTTQNNGQPLNDGMSTLLRGRSPLILIDGIPRSVTEIGVEEIESITVLKDAVALAMLGVRGAGGAISIVTKKGYVDKSEINFSGQWGVQSQTQNLISNPLDAYRYAQLYNEALTNDGLSVANNGFSNEALEAYRTGSNKFVYPNVNWRDEILQDKAPVARYNLNARGGNEFVKYFVNLEHFRQDGFLRTDSKNNYSTNANARGYFVRSNVDVKITDHLDGGVYIQGRLMSMNAPGNDGTASLFQSMLNTPNNAYPIYNPDGSLSGVPRFQNNIMGQSVGSGYYVGNTRTVLADFYLKGSLDDVLPGLWAKGRMSFFSNLRENYTRNKSFAIFQLVNSDIYDPVYKQYGNNTQQANGNAIQFQNKSNFQEFSLGYSKQRGKHNVDALVLANRDNLINGSNLALTIQGLSGHVSYQYNDRFLAEVAAAYNGANRYPKDGGFRYGLFPSAGLGWNVHNEAFLKKLNWLNVFKIHASYGTSGMDNGSYYNYIQAYNGAPTTYFGSSATTITTIAESYLANPNLTWEKAAMFNVGFDSRFLNNRLTLDVVYYSNQHKDLSIVRGTNSGTLGITYPNENIGRQRNYGVEIDLGWKEDKAKFGYFIRANASFQNSKLVYSAEPAQAYDWMWRTGHQVGQNYGYIANGLFKDPAELVLYPTIEGYQPQLGDIKYKDLNNDGIINQYDQGPIGSEKPEILLGTTLGFKVAGFDFAAFLQGSLNRQVYLSGNSYREFLEGTSQAYEMHLDRWTPDNPNASYPRLSTNGGPFNGEINNNVTSTFWLRNGNYLRLRSVELGYSLPAAVLKRVKLNAARVFVNGYNLVSFASKTFNGADPENYRGLYPIQKVVSVGVHIQLL